jgi:hypothetical protein
MDQQTLGCKYPIIHAPDLDCSSSMNSANPGNTASMLRSHSDSRIHIPHFLSVKDKGLFLDSRFFLFILSQCFISLFTAYLLFIDWSAF